MGLSAAAMTCCAAACGTRGSPKASASRSTARENSGRISGANQRSSATMMTTVTRTSARYRPVTPVPSCITSTSLTTIVSTERTSVSRLNVTVFRSIRSTWNGMNVKPIANVLTAIRRNAAAYARLPRNASAIAGAAASSAASTTPFSASRKKKMVLAIRRRSCSSRQS